MAYTHALVSIGCPVLAPKPYDPARPLLRVYGFFQCREEALEHAPGGAGRRRRLLPRSWSRWASGSWCRPLRPPSPTRPLVWRSDSRSTAGEDEGARLRQGTHRLTDPHPCARDGSGARTRRTSSDAEREVYRPLAAFARGPRCAARTTWCCSSSPIRIERGSASSSSSTFSKATRRRTSGCAIFASRRHASDPPAHRQDVRVARPAGQGEGASTFATQSCRASSTANDSRSESRSTSSGSRSRRRRGTLEFEAAYAPPTATDAPPPPDPPPSDPPPPLPADLGPVGSTSRCGSNPHDGRGTVREQSFTRAYDLFFYPLPLRPP